MHNSYFIKLQTAHAQEAGLTNLRTVARGVLKLSIPRAAVLSIVFVQVLNSSFKSRIVLVSVRSTVRAAAVLSCKTAHAQKAGSSFKALPNKLATPSTRAPPNNRSSKMEQVKEFGSNVLNFFSGREGGGGGDTVAPPVYRGTGAPVSSRDRTLSVHGGVGGGMEWPPLSLERSESIVINRGLRNRPGENNCFLNAAVQVNTINYYY